MPGSIPGDLGSEPEARTLLDGTHLSSSVKILSPFPSSNHQLPRLHLYSRLGHSSLSKMAGTLEEQPHSCRLYCYFLEHDLHIGQPCEACDTSQIRTLLPKRLAFRAALQICCFTIGSSIVSAVPTRMPDPLRAWSDLCIQHVQATLPSIG